MTFKTLLPYGTSIPATWKIVPLKHLASFANGFAFKSEHRRENGTPIIRIENLNGSENFNYSNLHLPDRYRILQGDLLYSWSGNPGTSFGPFRWKTPGSHYLNQHIFKLFALDCDKDWLYWTLKAATHWIERELTSGMIGMVHVTKEELGSVPIPIPTLEEQRRIANFLDAETGKLDGIIRKKQRLISLMNERIDSRILNHVGESRLVNSRNGAAVQSLRGILTKIFRPPVAEVDTITAYRDGQVTARGLRRAEGYTLSASTEPQGQHVQVDDVVIHGLDGFAGAIGTSEAIGNCSPVYHVCIPATGGDPQFLGRLLRLLALQGYLGNFATSTRERAVDFRNWDLFGRIPIPVVSNEEQRDIGRLITNIRPLRGAVERSEVLAAERRRALITAAVTGQFDVSTASGRGVTE